MGTHKKGHEDLNGLEVLLVDDNDISRKILKSVLEHVGVHVTSVVNGAEAVSTVLGGSHFDLVLMDIEMPKMSGYQATRMIRSHKNFGGLPIIGLTGLSEEAEITHCLEVGMNDCVGKPFKMDRIYDVIEQFAEHHPKEAPIESDSEGEVSSDLPQLPGIDARDGLARAVGDMDLYREVLHDFAVRYQTAEKQILDNLAAGHLEAARTLVHTIKGIAGTLGAQKLYRLAGVLEQALRSGEDPAAEEALDYFLDELTWVIDGIDTYLGEFAANDSSPPPDVQLGDKSKNITGALSTLKKLVDDFDVSACDYFDTIRSDLSTSTNVNLINALAGHLRRLDFDEAAYVIEQLETSTAGHEGKND